MEKVKILIVVLTLSIFGVIISSAGYAIPFVQATSSDGNNNAQTFEGELLPQLSPSNEKVIQFEDTPTKTIAQSDNLQNPSIQADLNQSVLSSQKDVPDLQQSNPKQSKEKHDRGFDAGCAPRTKTDPVRSPMAVLRGDPEAPRNLVENVGEAHLVQRACGFCSHWEK